jgi:protein-glutamine gamma-glutamyltransferase
MIKVSGELFDPKELMSQYPYDSLEFKILNLLYSSERTYYYSTPNHLKFEISMRINIINASRELNRGGLKFKTFKEAFCNEKYWKLTEQGGFLLKEDVKASEAISDIFKNGKKYGTECATAIVILYYKAVLDIYPEELFNATFPKLHLISWDYIDDDLDIRVYTTNTESIPGDCRYFDNPDFNPDKSEWRGENAIDLGDGTYYGHGIGIKTAEGILTSLNKHRKPNAEKAAYLTDFINRPYYGHLADLYLNRLRSMRRQLYKELYLRNTHSFSVDSSSLY